MSLDQSDDESAGVATGVPQGGEPQGRECRPSWLSCIGMAMVGAVFAWGILRCCFPVMPMPDPPKQNVQAMFPSPEMLKVWSASLARVAMVNSIFALGVLAAVMSATLAIGQLAAQRSKAVGLVAAVAAALLGAGFGCLAGYFGHALGEMGHLGGGEADLAMSLVVHIAMLATLGGGVGLSVGVFMFRTLKAAAAALVAGLAAGFLAGAVYPALAALFFPAAPDLVVPAGGQRLMWIGVTALLLGVVVPGAVQDSRRV